MTLKDADEETLQQVQAEAAAWMSLLHSLERDAELEAGLKHWLTADPLHRQVWEVATDIWNDAAALPRRIPEPRLTRTRQRPHAYLRPALALALACLVAGSSLLQQFLHSRVNTTVGEQRTLTLEDGTRVELNTDSHLVVKYDSHARTIILNSGEAYFQVAHELRPFIVVAGDKKILALGTAFTVRRGETADDPLTVTLIEGRVAVAPADATPSLSTKPTADVNILNPGERLRVRRHDPPLLDSPPMDKATAWMRGQLIFDHTPLREAAAEFSRYNKIKITVISPEAAAIPIGGIFHLGDAMSFARAVAESNNLRLTLHDGELVLEPVPAASSP